MMPTIFTYGCTDTTLSIKILGYSLVTKSVDVSYMIWLDILNNFCLIFSCCKMGIFILFDDLNCQYNEKRRKICIKTF